MKIQNKSTYASSGTISEVNVKIISVIRSDSATWVFCEGWLPLLPHCVLRYCCVCCECCGLSARVLRVSVVSCLSVVVSVVCEVDAHDCVLHSGAGCVYYYVPSREHCVSGAYYCVAVVCTTACRVQYCMQSTALRAVIWCILCVLLRADPVHIVRIAACGVHYCVLYSGAYFALLIIWLLVFFKAISFAFRSLHVFDSTFQRQGCSWYAAMRVWTASRFHSMTGIFTLWQPQGSWWVGGEYTNTADTRMAPGVVASYGPPKPWSRWYTVPRQSQSTFGPVSCPCPCHSPLCEPPSATVRLQQPKGLVYDFTSLLCLWNNYPSV